MTWDSDLYLQHTQYHITSFQKSSLVKIDGVVAQVAGVLVDNTDEALIECSLRKWYPALEVCVD